MMPHFAPWFRREDYSRIREIMDDGDTYPKDFDSWESKAKSQKEEAARHGIIIQPITLDPEEFLAFCEKENLEPGSQARGLFAVSRGAAITPPKPEDS